MTNAHLHRIKQLSNGRKQKITFDLLEERNAKRITLDTVNPVIDRIAHEFSSIYARVKSGYIRVIHNRYFSK